MRNYLIIDGVNSKDKGLYISAGATYDTPERNRTMVSVVGKNGDLVMDNDSFKNITVKYPCFLYARNEAELSDKTRDVSSWLYSHTEYVRIEDTYNPLYYRMGVPSGTLNWSVRFARTGETELTFNCKPQLFYKSGDGVQTFLSAGTITNPSLFPSKPEIRVRGSGSGSLTIGNYTLQFSDIPEFIDINTELRYAYKKVVYTDNEGNLLTQYIHVFGNGEGLINDLVTATDNINYMQIDSGENAVSFSGGVTGVNITGKWWTI